MGSIDKKVEFCPLRHPSLNFTAGVCFYSSNECRYKDPKKCPTYNSVGRDYSLRVKQYRENSKEESRKE